MFFGCMASAVHLFHLEVVEMKLHYFVDTLFDLINESDALETDILDIDCSSNKLLVQMKDGTSFIVTVNEVEQKAEDVRDTQ